MEHPFAVGYVARPARARIEEGREASIKEEASASPARPEPMEHGEPLHKISDRDIEELTAVPLVYELNDDLSPIRSYYLDEH